MHFRSRPQFPQERPPVFALRVRLRPFDSMRELNDCHGRESGLGCTPRLLNLLQYVRNTVAAPFRRHEYIVSTKYNLIESPEFLPAMHHRSGIDLGDAEEYAGLQLIPGSCADMTKKGAGHFPEEGFGQV
jgi:hypothetical protein